MLRIYICTIIFSYIISLPYIIKMFKLDIKLKNPLIINVLATLFIFIIELIPILNIIISCLYYKVGQLSDKEFSKLMNDK